MHRRLPGALSVVFAGMIAAGNPADIPSRHRLIVLSDMGNEPDEVQQILHLLMCSNEIELEGLLAVSGTHLHDKRKEAYKSKLHPELHQMLIDGYEKVYPNLQHHASGWPTPSDLRSIATVGTATLGMDGVGEGKATPGSELIIRQVSKGDPRPVFIVANAGSSTLAQALYDYRKTHTPQEVDVFVAKLRVYENAAQDEAGSWIAHEFPSIHWVRSLEQTRCWGGPSAGKLGPYCWKPYPYTTKGQDDWANEHIRTGHGALGALYPIRVFGHFTEDNPSFIEGGGTIPWQQLLRAGHTDPSIPCWGSWSGRYTIEKVENAPARYERVLELEQHYRPWAMYVDAEGRWTHPETGKEERSVLAPVWPWRQAMWNDFQARMDWCVKSYAEANHHPQAALDGDASDAIVRKSARPGETLSFDASASTDPDGDSLRYHWWCYDEAGERPYGKKVAITSPTSPNIDFTIPDDAAGKQIHLILEVWDESDIVPLVDYRRIVLNINEL